MTDKIRHLIKKESARLALRRLAELDLIKLSNTGYVNLAKMLILLKREVDISAASEKAGTPEGLRAQYRKTAAELSYEIGQLGKSTELIAALEEYERLFVENK